VGNFLNIYGIEQIVFVWKHDFKMKKSVWNASDFDYWNLQFNVLSLLFSIFLLLKLWIQL